ncbi:unnamed protein product [Darwinula stevensoni]|uniref:C2 domain-containing protein n=1 Tax=Darwinula stevensoni TaxID=69355 RepID=A0A7R9FTM2_9CRUS|nr:unnamed protein product [Darwinula stevensoni]CAG0905012.1 unnamed protein product [Darwinula stevensoni]
MKRRKNGMAAERWTGSSAEKAQDFQVSITIIEARRLAGLNMDPMVQVQVDGYKKYTHARESTNCPYYDEYFVFDFNLPSAELLDKLITLTVSLTDFFRVFHCRKWLRPGPVVGTFKLDLWTVYHAPGKQLIISQSFHHKWAVLLDPDDPGGGPRGYLKVDIGVTARGCPLKVPPKKEKEDDEIEE